MHCEFTCTNSQRSFVCIIGSPNLLWSMYGGSSGEDQGRECVSAAALMVATACSGLGGEIGLAAGILRLSIYRLIGSSRGDG